MKIYSEKTYYVLPKKKTGVKILYDISKDGDILADLDREILEDSFDDDYEPPSYHIRLIYTNKTGVHFINMEDRKQTLRVFIEYVRSMELLNIKSINIIMNYGVSIELFKVIRKDYYVHSKHKDYYPNRKYYLNGERWGRLYHD